MESETSIDIDNLVCFSTKPEIRTYKSKILDKTYRFVRSTVTEYVDTSTGEILTPKQVHKLGVKEIDYCVLLKERNDILDSFRKEVKEFAVFVLLFRNKRRGLSPNLNHVVEYYSKYTGQRIDNIKRRLLPKIMNKIVFSDTLMMPPFQISGMHTKAREHLQEDFVSEVKFFLLMQRKGFIKQNCL